jgi:hypothetical protein
MIKHKAGLHKDVATIFEGVWIPQIDDIQPFPAASPVAPSGTAVLIHPKPIALEKWSKEAKTSVPQKASKRISWSFFSPKARRERKRLSLISRNLLIKLPD